MIRLRASPPHFSRPSGMRSESTSSKPEKGQAIHSRSLERLFLVPSDGHHPRFTSSLPAVLRCGQSSGDPHSAYMKEIWRRTSANRLPNEIQTQRYPMSCRRIRSLCKQGAWIDGPEQNGWHCRSTRQTQVKTDESASVAVCNSDSRMSRGDCFAYRTTTLHAGSMTIE